MTTLSDSKRAALISQLGLTDLTAVDMSNADLEAAFWAAGGGNSSGGSIVLRSKHIPGEWGSATLEPSNTPVSLVPGDLSLSPVEIGEALTIDQLLVNVTTLGAGALCTVGVYANDPNGPMGFAPSSSPLLDAGTIDCSTTGNKTKVVSLDLPAGIYWLAALCSGAGASFSAHNMNNGSSAAFGLSSRTTAPSIWATGSWGRLTFLFTGVSGSALPVLTPTNAARSFDKAVRVAFRRA